MAQLEYFIHPLAVLTVQYTKTEIFDKILKLNIFQIDYRVPIFSKFDRQKSILVHGFLK